MPNDYDIGFGKPPLYTRFKPGQSGNPNGRPKGTKNLKTDLEEELRESIIIREGGNSRAVSKQRAMLKGLTAKAIQGDCRAVAAVLKLVERYLEVEPSSASPRSDWPPLGQESDELKDRIKTIYRQIAGEEPEIE